MDLTDAGPQQFVLDCYPDQTIDYDKPPGTPVVRLRVRWRGQGPPTIVTSSGGVAPPTRHLDEILIWVSASADEPKLHLFNFAHADDVLFFSRAQNHSRRD